MHIGRSGEKGSRSGRGLREENGVGMSEIHCIHARNCQRAREIILEKELCLVVLNYKSECLKHANRCIYGFSS